MQSDGEPAALPATIVLLSWGSTMPTRSQYPGVTSLYGMATLTGRGSRFPAWALDGKSSWVMLVV
jgi:hypothetical protein